MSRFNNPESLMGLLTVATAYFVIRALENTAGPGTCWQGQPVNSSGTAYFIWQQPIVDEIPLGKDTVPNIDWIQSTFKGENIDGLRIYDLQS